MTIKKDRDVDFTHNSNKAISLIVVSIHNETRGLFWRKSVFNLLTKRGGRQGTTPRHQHTIVITNMLQIAVFRDSQTKPTDLLAPHVRISNDAVETVVITCRLRAHYWRATCDNPIGAAADKSFLWLRSSRANLYSIPRTSCLLINAANSVFKGPEGSSKTAPWALQAVRCLCKFATATSSFVRRRTFKSSSVVFASDTDSSWVISSDRTAPSEPPRWVKLFDARTRSFWKACYDRQPQQLFPSQRGLFPSHHLHILLPQKQILL